MPFGLGNQMFAAAEADFQADTVHGHREQLGEVGWRGSIEGNGKPTEIMPGVAIIADTTWAAFEARKRLEVEWDETGASKDSWSDFVKRAAELGKQPVGAQTLVNTGSVDEALKGAAKTVSGFYTYPFVSHAPLEPQNCTAWAHDGIVELWSPTQTADRALEVYDGAGRPYMPKVRGHDHFAS